MQITGQVSQQFSECFLLSNFTVSVKLFLPHCSHPSFSEISESLGWWDSREE